jgi:hypothetical protein
VSDFGSVRDAFFVLLRINCTDGDGMFDELDQKKSGKGVSMFEKGCYPHSFLLCCLLDAERLLPKEIYGGDSLQSLMAYLSPLPTRT